MDLEESFSEVVESHWSNVSNSVQVALLLSTGLEETKRVLSVWIIPSVHHIPQPMMLLTHHTCTYGSTRSTVKKKNIFTVEPRSKDKRLIWTPVYYYNGNSCVCLDKKLSLKITLLIRTPVNIRSLSPYRNKRIIHTFLCP